MAKKAEDAIALLMSDYRSVEELFDKFESAKAPAKQATLLPLTFVARQVEKLPQSQARSLRLVAIEGLSYDDAAARTGLPIGTIKVQVSRARKALSISSSCDLKMEYTDVVPPESVAAYVRAASDRLRNAWAEAKRAGQTLVIG